jgi:hypothetical protein
MNQTNHFFDVGYGWLCKHCSAADTEAKHQPREAQAGFFGNAEPDQKQSNPPAPALALATWTDPSHHSLVCPRCGIKESIKND